MGTFCRDSVIYGIVRVYRLRKWLKSPSGDQTVLFVRLVYGFSMPRRCSDIWGLVDGDEMAILGERTESVVINSVGTWTISCVVRKSLFSF